MTTLFSKEHRILEKGMMEFQPFGRRPDGTSIRDLSGVVTRAHLEYLQDVVSRKQSADAGRHAVGQLVTLLNERIPDPAYHVTESFLRNPWHSYSNEFSAFVGEFSVDISGEPDFAFGMAREKAIPPVIQVLGRPFPVAQIYKMSAYFSRVYAERAFLVEATSVTDRTAVLRMTLSKPACEHFGPYQRRCAYLWCISVKGYFVGVPERFHGLPPAQVTVRRCIAEGDDSCEWDVRWSVKQRRAWGMGWLDGGLRGRSISPSSPRSEQAAPSVDGALSAKGSGAMPGARPAGPDKQTRQTTLLTTDHRITEKGMMEFQPFGQERDGTAIRDLSGVVIRADVEYLEEFVSRGKGEEAGGRAVQELVQRLNENIQDPAYHVTAKFLRNPWNSYSAEFAAFCAETCIAISGDQQFLFNMARQKAISPVITTLGKPFSVRQIYKMSAYFAQRYAKDSFYTEAIRVSDSSAIIQMRFSDRTVRQFGPYRNACAEHWCNAHRGYFVGVPEMFHGLPEATIVDRHCIAKGDDHCEWEVSWSPREEGQPIRRAILSAARHVLRSEFEQKETVMAEQVKTLDVRHVELQEAYVQQQQLTADLQRRVDQLTTLHETGLVFTSILAREALIETVLDTIVHKLHYDRAMITFFDAARQLSHGARVRGFPSQFAELAGKMEIPISDPETIEGTVLLKGEPVLVKDIREAAARLHPYNQQLAQAAQAKSIISVPLKIKSEVLGALTVDRIQEWALTQDDLKLIETLATQVAIALDNTKAYGQIEELNVGLEAKVRQRTTELEQAMAILKRFFSPQLADLLVTGGRDDLLRSHRREITVVFLDLRGYSSFAETAEPEEVTGLLQDYQTTMGELIIQYNGTLERFTGDGMMIFFNDPVPMPNASETAVRMAHAMRQTFSKLQNKWIIRGYQLGLGIGIAYGPATMGTIGFEGRWDYAAIGPVTNLASRLCSEAQHGQILVSRQFLQTVENVVVPELIGELTLKGFRRPVSTYNIKALKV